MWRRQSILAPWIVSVHPPSFSPSHSSSLQESDVLSTHTSHNRMLHRGKPRNAAELWLINCPTIFAADVTRTETIPHARVEAHEPQNRYGHDINLPFPLPDRCSDVARIPTTARTAQPREAHRWSYHCNNYDRYASL